MTVKTERRHTSAFLKFHQKCVDKLLSYRADKLTGKNVTCLADVIIIVHTNKPYGLWWGQHNMPQPPASSDLDSHPEHSANRRLDINVPVKHTHKLRGDEISLTPRQVFDL